MIYVDLDGVLADFDRSAERVLGADNIYKYEFVYGAEAFWRGINTEPYFFESMYRKEDAFLLWEAIEHTKPTILTALPRTNAKSVEEQKRVWVLRNFGASVPVICCRTKDKPNHCQPGDVMIDDRAVNMDAWMLNGGHYIVHHSAASTIQALRRLQIISAPRTNG